MISIDQNKCIGCGRCVKECFPGNIGMAEGKAIDHSPELQKYLGIKEGYKAYAILVIGHPDVKFERTVPRKKADVIWH